MAKQPTGQEDNLEEASKAYQKAQIRFTLKTDNLLEEEEQRPKRKASYKDKQFPSYLVDMNFQNIKRLSFEIKSKDSPVSGFSQPEKKSN